MKKRMTTLICLLIVAATAAVPAHSSKKEWVQSQREQMESMVTRVDYFIQQAQRISQAANQAQHTSGRAGSAEYANIIQTGNSILNIAKEIKTSLQRSQDLLENETLMKDEEIKRDLLAARTQFSNMVSSLGNTLQYMEHMVYRLNQPSENR